MTMHRQGLGAVVLLLAILLLLFLLPAICFRVDEREYAVVLQFGDPIKECTDPGLYFKVPVVQTVRKLPKTKQLWRGEPLPDLPTADGKKIIVVPWAIWRINDPTAFVQVLKGDVRNGETRVAQYVRGVVRDVITQYDLSDVVRSTDRELTHSFGVDPSDPISKEEIAKQLPQAPARVIHGREKILAQIKRDATRKLASATGSDQESGTRGIELVDIGISMIDFVPAVRQAAFERQIALMQSIASLHTNEGERLKQEILNRTNAETQRIEGEGTQRANELRGEVDAEVIRAYAEAIEEAGEFYTFVRTLEAYKKAIDKDTRIILTTDSELFRLLKELDRAPTGSPDPTTTAESR